ncbi:MAG: ABC transporter substrate-binding protein [Lachnospiraceae bacterium]|nr:ABC transporter substrate-binding protein [Lachnospiraceae bacterium]
MHDKDESFYVEITFEGGSGKAHIESPVKVETQDGKMSACFVWSSKNYDYMMVDGVRYDNENAGGYSTFHVPIDNITEPLTVIGDTTAMSTPHEIEYVITWGEKVAGPEEESGESAAGDSNGGSGDSGSGIASSDGDVDASSGDERKTETIRDALGKAGLTKTEEFPLSYANCFSAEKYGDYTLLLIGENGEYGRYLIVPKECSVPEGLPAGLNVLQQPLDKAYLASTSAMDLIVTCGALENIKLSGTKESDWYVDEAREAMVSGDLVYAGKYRAPDYELILSSGCDLAIENTMIYHEPAVSQKLEELGIPVLVEQSSYESHPLGRLEWIKVYGLLFDREKEAESYFNEQLSILEPLLAEKPDTGKTVAFFHVTAAGMINVRKSGDYITKMITLAGGEYVPSTAGEEEDNALSTMNMQMEDFYSRAADADILIYNSTIAGEISSVKQLTDLNPLFKDFKAVKEGQVYCTERNLFQQTTGVAAFMQDLQDIFAGKDGELTYITKLDEG